MSLRSIEIENYRGIARGRVTLGDTTVVFGENDSGRTRFVEALLLSLGAPGEALEDRLRPFHFHRTDGRAARLHIRLHVRDDGPERWPLPGALSEAFPSWGGDGAELVVDFRARLDAGTGAIHSEHTLRSPRDRGVVVGGTAETARWLRSLFPVLWIPPGGLAGAASAGAAADEAPVEVGDDPTLRALALHHRNLVAGDVPDLAAELEAGAGAANDVLERFSDVFATGGPLLGALTTEILERSSPSRDRVDPSASTAAQKIATLLLLGAILQLVRRAQADGPLPSAATPILVIESPEANLHPITLASVWRIIERITWQTIVTTDSDTVLARAPLTALRRVTRHGETVREWAIDPAALSREEQRKVAYHLRSRRAAAMFARCWILVEGETEYWVLPELARVLGHDLAAEGVACVEFAQSGLRPLLVFADKLGIACQVLVDGDEAGHHYAEAAGAVATTRVDRERPLTMLYEPDIEHCFWRNGFADVIRDLAAVADPETSTPTRFIRKAIERTSKPYLALSLIDAAARRGPQSVPQVLRDVIESSIRLARS